MENAALCVGIIVPLVRYSVFKCKIITAGYYTLSEWRQKRKVYGDHAFVGSGIHRDAPLNKNERRLMKENTELRKAN